MAPGLPGPVYGQEGFLVVLVSWGRGERQKQRRGRKGGEKEQVEGESEEGEDRVVR